MSDTIEKTNPKVKSTLKDSVFCALFRNQKYLLQLYKELHPEDTDVTEDDIHTQSLNAVFVNTLYNDLGFTVEKNGISHFVILMEAQSIWNNNITMRMFIYLGATYYKYLGDKDLELTEKTKITLPAPELYLVYTGDDRKNIPDTLELRDQMFEGRGMVDMTVNVIHSTGSTIIGQYIAFCKVLNEQAKLYGHGKKAIEETIKICLESGILDEFIGRHRQEVMSMLAAFFDEDSQREMHEKAVRAKAKAEGMAEGEARGRAEGIAKGRAEGIAKGFLQALSNLVKSGLISLSDAAQQAKMTEEEFANTPQMKDE